MSWIVDQHHKFVVVLIKLLNFLKEKFKKCMAPLIPCKLSHYNQASNFLFAFMLCFSQKHNAISPLICLRLANNASPASQMPFSEVEKSVIFRLFDNITFFS